MNGSNVIGQAVGAISEAVRRLTASIATLTTALLLYVLLLGLVFLFLTTRESNVGQVVLGLVVWPLLAVLVFFVAQAFGLVAVQVSQFGIGTGHRLKRALYDSVKLIIVTLPVMVLASLILLGVDYLDEQLIGLAPQLNQSQLHWLGRGRAALSLAQAVLLWVILPLLTIHCWISVLQAGVWRAIRGAGLIFQRALSPGSILVYLLTAGLYLGLAWLLFRVRPAIEREWLELWLFALRMALGLLVIFLGWLLTLGALAVWVVQRESDG